MESKITAFIQVPENEDPFTKIYGLTVIERTLHALERGGVNKVFLPIERQEILEKLIQKKKGWEINIQFSSEFTEDAKKAPDGALFLTTPLVIDIGCIQQLRKKVEQTQIATIDKNKVIAWFPATVISKTDIEHLMDSSQWLALAEQKGVGIETIDFNELVCSPVSGIEEKKSVEKALLRNLIKPTDGWVSRHLNRPVSISISRVLAHTSVTPNQFTIVIGLVGISIAWFAAAGGYWNYLIGGALFHLTSVLDGVDGELARLKFKSSPFGQWLDTLADNLTYLAALAGLVIGMFLHGASDVVKWAGLLSVIFALLAFGSLYFYLLRFKSGGSLLNVKYGYQNGNGAFNKMIRVASAFGRRDLFALIFLVLAILGKIHWALIYVAVMAFLLFALSIQAHITAFKDQRKDLGKFKN